MIELKTQEGYNLIWSSDLAKFANQFLDREWDLHQGEDFPAQNYSTHFEIGPRDYIVDDEDADFESWLSGGQLYPNIEDMEYFQDAEPDCESMMQYLFNRGLIPAGKYLVYVWW